ncbi:Prephenate dehydratase-domain-containing protein [Melanogaster broomeanus]|nr:Prephenate dehydratase-domain-containing protein [Melanogaster broomeanus]
MFTSSLEKPKVAFLGPLGTYSHQAAYECFKESAEYFAQANHRRKANLVLDVQRTLSAEVPFGIIPQENSINGSVVETYNLLRDPAVGRETFVRGLHVVRQGVKLEDVENVLSHEQGQCRTWLTEHLPTASLVPTDSTAKAAEKLLSAEPGDINPSKCAAICSSVVVTIYDGLEILQEGIQDGEQNCTRFYILSYGLDVALPAGCLLPTENTALLRIQAPSESSTTSKLDIAKAISALDLVVLRIDRRPSLHATLFEDVYFLEIGAAPDIDVERPSWPDQLQQAVERVKHLGVEVAMLGLW